MRVSRTTWFVAVAALVTALVPAAAADAAPAATGASAVTARAPYCGLTWGSRDRSVGGQSSSHSITAVRAGRHACFDRLVVDGATWARVGYVSVVYTEGAGQPVPLRGGARLQIVTDRSESVATGQATFVPANRKELVNLTGYRTFRQAAYAGSFEGQTTLGLGVRARLPFRVFVIPASGGQPSRVVVDVAHAW